MEIQHVLRDHHNCKIILKHFVLVLEQDHHFCTESHQINVAVEFPMCIMSCFHFWQATREKNKAFRGMLFVSMFQEKPITSSQQLQGFCSACVCIPQSSTFLVSVDQLAFTGGLNTLMAKHGRHCWVSILFGMMVNVLHRN